jgi:hypothetical protein
MEMVLRCCAGLDAHKKSVVACIRRIADDDRLEENVCPFGTTTAELLALADWLAVPGVRFASAAHLCRWAGLSPGNNHSAGKRKSGRTTKGSCWRRSVLVQAAWAASHTKDTIPGARYRRWVKRMGRKRALVALGHKILVLVYKLLSDEIGNP